MKNIFLIAAAMVVLAGMAMVAYSQQPCFGPGGCAPIEPPWVGPSPTPPPNLPPTQPCFGPAGCAPDAPVSPPGARSICLGSFGCMPVAYAPVGLVLTATVVLPNGYPLTGLSGPCLPGWDCPGLQDDADRDLKARLGQLHRFQRFLGQ